VSEAELAATPVARATLRYDSDCAFCTSSARWIEARGGGRVRLEAAPGIAAAEFLDGDGRVRRGGAAVMRAYALATGRRWVRLLDVRGVSRARDAAYAAIAHSRWVLSRLTRRGRHRQAG
jgi:predicted DCC family thiol-disulfide oxidoreductase YuxK